MATRVGTNSSDVIIGTVFDDFISGLDGDDSINGRAGNDRLYGGAGNDTLNSGAGTDLMFGDLGNDTFLLTDLDIGAKTVIGGLGRDHLSYELSNSSLSIDLLSGLGSRAFNSTTVIDNYSGIEIVTGSSAADQIFGANQVKSVEEMLWTNAFDDIEIFNGTAGADTYDGRGGHDRYVAMNSFLQNSDYTIVGIQVLLNEAGVGTVGTSFYTDVNMNGRNDAGDLFSTVTQHSVSNIESFFGTAGRDTFTGSNYSDYFNLGSDRGYEGDGELGIPQDVEVVNGRLGFDYLSLSLYGQAIRVDMAKGQVRFASLYDDYPEEEIGSISPNDYARFLAATFSNIEGIVGTAYDDVIYGDINGNYIEGNSGIDSIDGREGNDSIRGGDGSDILFGNAGDDLLEGGFGSDVLDGGGGIDTAYYYNSNVPISVDLLTNRGFDDLATMNDNGHEGIGDTLFDVENVIGSRHDDLIRGDDKNNRLEGARGDDKLEGCDGDDVIYGDLDPSSFGPKFDAGEDSETGLGKCGCDPSTLPTRATNGVDIYSYDDVLDGGKGNDTLFGQFGYDILHGRCGDDVISGGALTDLLFGDEGDDTLNGGSSFDILFGGDGFDLSDYRDSTAGVIADLSAFWRNRNGDAASDFITQIIDMLTNGQSPETIQAAGPFIALLGVVRDQIAADVLVIPDVTIGVEGIIGSAFNDQLFGNDQTNVLRGGLGADLLDGRGGIDIASYADARSAVSIFLNNLGGSGGEEFVGDNFVSIEGLEGSEFNDRLGGDNSINILRGRGGDDTLQGLGGDDTLEGGAGADQIDGGIGNDTASYEKSLFGVTIRALNGSLNTNDAEGDVFVSIEHVIGSQLNDVIEWDNLNNTLSGLDGDDIILGLDGNDVIFGDGGKDTIYGGVGNDSLFGGDGNDLFGGDTGNDSIYGGSGFDTAFYTGARNSAFIQAFNSGGQIVTRVVTSNGLGVDGLLDVEQIQFGTTNFSLNGSQVNRVANVAGTRFDDVIFHNQSTGQSFGYFINNGTVSGAAALSTANGSQWRAVDSGDFSGDGRADLFLQNTSTGAIAFAQMGGSTISSYQYFSTALTASWRMVAAADMDGDAFLDIVVQNNTTGDVSVADFTGASFNSWKKLSMAGPLWRVNALGDVNRDGLADVIYQHQGTGVISAGLMTAKGQIGSFLQLTDGSTLNWVVRAAGDITGDGFDDILIQNQTTGNVSYVNTNEGRFNGFGTVVTGFGAGWLADGLIDSNNDGDLDVVMRNITNGNTLIANVESGVFQSFTTVATGIGSQWYVV